MTIERNVIGKLISIITVSILMSACGGGSSGDSAPAASGGSATAGENNGETTTGGDTGTGTGGESGGTTGGDITGGDMSGGDTAGMNGTDIATAIQGSWMSACKSFSSINSSEREINVFTGTQLIRDWYTYENTECNGVPRGETFPQRIYSYEIGSDIVTAEGFPAKELNLVIDRVSDVGYLRDAAQLGQQRYDIITFDNGTLLRTGDERTSLESRPNDFSIPTVFTAREPITADIVQASDFVGTFRSNCEQLSDGSNSTITNEISTDSTGYTERVEFYFGTECGGDIVGVTERYYQETFGETFKTIFGDTMIAVDWSRTATVIVEGADVLSGLNLGAPQNSFDAYAIVNGNTLMRGYCFNNSVDCKKTASERADMIDLEFNSDVRYMKVE